MKYFILSLMIINFIFTSCTPDSEEVNKDYKLSVKLTTELKLNLVWDSLSLSNDIKNYELYKSINKDAGYIKIATINYDSSLSKYSYIDDFTIDAKETYYYKVRAITIISNEEFSEIVSYKAITDIDGDGFIETDCAANIASINPEETEICDNIDNNCSGSIDDNIDDIIVGIDTGECQQGISKCINGITTITQTEIKPINEFCDGKDNDCNDLVDDNIDDIVTGSNTGECQVGIKRCVNKELAVIQEEIKPISELCDGKDNNCNNIIDDMADIISGTNTGECQVEIKRCVNEEVILIQEEITPTDEICDNLDNNCNNQIDENLFKNCSNVCENGDTICIEGHWLGCDAAVSKAEEWTSNSPLKRTRFAQTQNKDDNIFIFSGKLASGELSDELWNYNTISKTWKKLIPQGELPVSRSYASLTYKSTSKELFLYGGVDFNGNILSDFWKFDIENRSWTQISARGTLPPKLSGLMLFSDNYDNIILFGGKESDTIINGSTYKYSISENRWYLIDSSLTPSARFNHSIVNSITTNSLFIFGGNTDDTNFSNELWKFNLNTFDWSLESSDSEIPNITNSSMYSKENYIYAFGGLTEDNLTNFIVYKYNINTKTWEIVTLQQDNIISSMVIGDGSDLVSIWGGEKLNNDIFTMDMKFDLDTETYYISNDISSIYKATTTYNNINNKNYLFGGFQEQGFSNDLWEYSQNNNIWEKIYLSNQPEPREASSIAFSEDENYLYLYGGNDDSHNYGDLWILDLNSGTSWEKLSITDGPSYRKDAYLFYRRGNIYLFGGTEEGVSKLDLYRLNKTEEKWEKINYLNTSPDTRDAYSVIYSEANNYLFLFAGSKDGNKSNDLWSLDIDSKKWVNYSIGIVKPSKRDNSYFLYDYNKGSVYLFGGVDENDNHLADLWSLEIGSSNWTVVKENSSFENFNQRDGLNTFFVNNNDNHYIYVLGGKSSTDYFYLPNKLNLICE